MSRTRLLNRRPQISTEIVFGGQLWTLSCGFDDGGKVRELFLFTTLGGSDIEALVDDAAIMISLLLQHGLSIRDLARHLGRQGIDATAPAASLLGLAVITAAKIEAHEGGSR